MWFWKSFSKENLNKVSQSVPEKMSLLFGSADINCRNPSFIGLADYCVSNIFAALGC